MNDETTFFVGKSALIVGGTGGIGRELSLALSETGAQLVIHGSHSCEKQDSLIKKIAQKTGQSPLLFTQDVLEWTFSELENSPLFLEARKCDILCVCFGPFVQKALHETHASDWERAALFDYAFPGLLVSNALPNMMKNKWGRILVFGGTGTAHRAEFLTNSAYAGAKAGLNVLVASTAASYASYGITCNAILPGFTETEYLSEEQKISLSAKMPFGTMVSASSVAKAALSLLASPDINGALLRVDRGWTSAQSVTSVC